MQKKIGTSIVVLALVTSVAQAADYKFLWKVTIKNKALYGFQGLANHTDLIENSVLH